MALPNSYYGDRLLSEVQKLTSIVKKLPSMNEQQTSQERFVDLGQTLYVEWLKTCKNMKSATEQERREIFKFAAETAFEAAAEFAKVFRHQEDN